MNEQFALADGTMMADEAERPLWPALRRGWSCRCPKCGAGPMMRAYLKVRDHCPVCGEAFHHHRADDGPAYLTILIVGHILAPLIYFVFTTYRPEPLVMASIFTVLTVALALFLLPRLKGVLVALQWAKRMHGFGAIPDPVHD
ncbi:MAG: DUF983 domain-containing protein [Paracoccaceae bacterium]